MLPTLQIQRNLATDGNIEEMQKVALVSDSKAKVGASLGYNVRTLLKDLGLEVCCLSLPSVFTHLPHGANCCLPWLLYI